MVTQSLNLLASVILNRVLQKGSVIAITSFVDQASECHYHSL